MLEALRRGILRARKTRRCPHFHPTRAGREACERRLNLPTSDQEARVLATT
jgi:hypothetical protein